MPWKSSLFIRGFAFEFYNKTFRVDYLMPRFIIESTYAMAVRNEQTREKYRRECVPASFPRPFRPDVVLNDTSTSDISYQRVFIFDPFESNRRDKNVRTSINPGATLGPSVRETQASAVQYTVIIVGFDRRFSSAVRVRIVTCSKPLRAITKRVFIYTRESTRAAINATTINHTRN